MASWIGEDVIDHKACYGGKNHHGGGHDGCAKKLSQGEAWVALEVGKDAQDGIHEAVATRV